LNIEDFMAGWVGMMDLMKMLIDIGLLKMRGNERQLQ
jgi:hypothetical protein